MSSAKDKIIDRLLNVYLARRDTAGLITTIDASTPANIGDTTVKLTSVTGLAVGDIFFLGSGETLEPCTASAINTGTKVVTPEFAIKKAHAALDPAQRAIGYDLGKVLAGGVNGNVAAAIAEIKTADSRFPMAVLAGFATGGADVVLPCFTVFSFLMALGMKTARAQGSGTTASPYHLATDGSDFGGEADQVFIGVGITADGSIVRTEFWGSDADYTGVSYAMVRGSTNGIALKFKTSSGIFIASTAPTFTPSTLFKSSANTIFDHLTEAGNLVAGTPTTTTALQAKDDTTLVLTSAASVAAGTILEVTDADGTVEHVQVHSLATLTATLRTPLMRAHISGVAVTPMTPTRFAAIGDAGVTLAMSGSITEIKAADFRFPIWNKANEAKLKVTMPVLQVTAAVLAQALGVPAADISSNAFFASDHIGTRTITGMYAKGVLKNGDIGWVIFGNVAMTAEAVKVVLDIGGSNGNPIDLIGTALSEFRVFHGPGL